MVTRSEKIKAAIFFLSGTALLAGFLLFFGYLQLEKEGVRYSSLFKNVSSLRKGTPVKYNGVEVGEVASIEISRTEPGKVRVNYEVKPPHDRHITDNTVAQLVYLNPLTGQQGISLAPRSVDAAPEAEKLRPGSSIPTAPSEMAATVEAIQSSLDNLNSLLSQNRQHVGNLLKNTNRAMEGVQELLPKLQEISERLQKTMDKAESSFAAIEKTSSRVGKLVGENQQEINRAVENLVKTSTAVRSSVSENKPTLKAAVKDLRDSSARLKSLVQDLRSSWPAEQVDKDVQNWSRTLEELKKMSQKGDDLTRSLGQTTDALRGTVRENRETVRTTLQQLSRTVRTLEEFSRKIEAQPSLLLRSDPPEKRELQ